MAYTPLKHGTPVSWRFHTTHGYGYIESVIIKGPTAARTKYKIRQVDDHVGANGKHEPTYVEHWGSNVEVIASSTVKAKAAAAKAQPDKG